MSSIKSLNRDQLINRNAELENLNRDYRGQIIRTGVNSDAIFRRAGELSWAMEKFMDGDMDKTTARAHLANNQPNGESRFSLVANIVDAATELASGDETAMDRILDAATALKDYDATKVLGFTAQATATPVAGVPRKKSADNILTAEQAIAAMQFVATVQDDEAVLGRELDAMELALSADGEIILAVDDAEATPFTKVDVAAACGTWSDAQVAAGLTRTGRGYKKRAAGATVTKLAPARTNEQVKAANVA